MTAFLDQRHRVWLALGLLLLAALLTMLAPPEQVLGWVIRTVLLHGALVRVGMIAFSVAGLLGLIYLVRRSPGPYGWNCAVQKAAVVIWIVYALSSMVATKLAWGEWVAWSEPRTRISAPILWVRIACLLLVRWVDHRLFTAGVNVLLALAAWGLLRSAGIVRHPFDPIGSSNSSTYQLIFLALIAVLGALAVLLTIALHEAAARRRPAGPPDHRVGRKR